MIKTFVHISVSMFALKEYALDCIGKKQMPICRICDPLQGFSQTGTEFNVPSGVQAWGPR